MNGIGASSGICLGTVYKYEKEALCIERLDHMDPVVELAQFEKSLIMTENQIKGILESSKDKLDKDVIEIFEAHLALLSDPELVDNIKGVIRCEKVNAAFAVKMVSETVIMAFEAIEDDYIRERVADIKDVSERLLYNVMGKKQADLSRLTEPVILMARDLTPSETAQLNREVILGFITETGGRTSHSAIMARMMEIPAVVGLCHAYEEIASGDFVLMNGDSGDIYVNPDELTIKSYENQAHLMEAKKLLWQTYKHKSTLTADGVHVEIAANIGQVDDVEWALDRGAEGIGLFRTEFLYMGKKSFPSESDQFEAYKKVLEKMGDKPVVIRTLDIGGDKELTYFDMPKEMNPFLGNRATRLCMSNPEVFKVQLRALLRASAYGNLQIMFPMIATIDEFRDTKAFLVKTQNELLDEGVKGISYKLGIMIEIPAAAIIADVLAKEVDFFSIGTNDLIQYTFASDRMNNQVAYLYQPYNPSLLRLIDMVVKAAHKEGKWVGMCGEMCSETEALPLLIGLGLDELSMSASEILKSRHALSKIVTPQAQALVEKALQCDNQQQVKDLVRGYLGGIKL